MMNLNLLTTFERNQSASYQNSPGILEIEALILEFFEDSMLVATDDRLSEFTYSECQYARRM